MGIVVLSIDTASRLPREMLCLQERLPKVRLPIMLFFQKVYSPPN